ncbi:MAG: hypothetical protein IID44_05945 [Planctomycetes bacterium]|nr:hypothetical protein [Planctomycetota bacterium]
MNYFNDDREEISIGISPLIQPIQSLTVFFADFGGNPDNYPSIVSAGVGNQLPKMVVVSRRKLVFNNYRCVTTQIDCQQIK